VLLQRQMPCCCLRHCWRLQHSRRSQDWWLPLLLLLLLRQRLRSHVLWLFTSQMPRLLGHLHTCSHFR
jgi:hypothetical protein